MKRAIRTTSSMSSRFSTTSTPSTAKAPPATKVYKLRTGKNVNKYRKVVANDEVKTDITLPFLTTCANKYSCIYLFKVKECDDYYNTKIYKYGYTNDLKRRNIEHYNKYGEDISLTLHAYIPEYFLREAEDDVRQYFSSNKFKNTEELKSTELVTFKDEDICCISKFYSVVSEKYMQNFKTMYDQNEIMKRVLKI